MKQGFYDSIVFLSDGNDFLDYICFEFSYLECPEKLFDLLTSPLDNLSSKVFLDATNNQIEAYEVANRLK